MFTDNRVDQDLRQHEEAHEAAELKFINNYQDNLDIIVDESKRLLMDSCELLSKGYIECVEPDVFGFLCAVYKVYTQDFESFPESFKRELFQGVCRDLGHDFDDYSADLMKSV